MYEGEVTLLKRPESMYDDNEKRIKIDYLKNIANPKDSGNEKYGREMGILKG
jgi:hypothetical protein